MCTCSRTCAEKLMVLAHTQCVVSQSSAHGNDRQDPSPTALNDTEGGSCRLWGDLELSHRRLISGTLTSGSGWLQRRLKGIIGNQSCRQSLYLRLGTGCKFWIILVMVGGCGGMKQGKVSHTLPGPSPAAAPTHTPVGSEVHLPGDELAHFISPPSHPFTHSFSPSFPHPPPVPMSSLVTPLLYNIPLLGHHPPLPHTFLVQAANK